MALTKAKKQEVVEEVAKLLSQSKMTVVASYPGTTVQAIQTLRKTGRANGTTVRIIKNRLLIQALGQSEALKNVETAALRGQLLYAFNADDEVLPAKTLNDFARTNPTITFVGAINADGQFLSSTEVKALASLPSKPQLIAGIINILQSPVNNVLSGLSGNLHGLLDAVATSKG